MNISRVAFIMYPVTDIKRAQVFYTEMLGLTQAGLSTDFWVEFEIAGVTFGIGNFEQVGTPGSAQSLAIEVQDLAEFRLGLAQKGLTSTEPYEFPNCILSMIHDPDGNTILLHQLRA